MYISTLPEDDPQKRVETCRNSSVSTIKTLHRNIVDLLVYPWILTFWRRTFFQILAHPVFKM